MQQTGKKIPKPAVGSGISHNNIHLQDHFAQPASIRRRYGSGWRAYEQAKAEWSAAHPRAEPQQYAEAMRRIARALGV